MTSPCVEYSAETGALWLDNGILRLGVVPALGGRLLSLRLLTEPDAVELVWRNEKLLTDELTPRPGHVPAPHAGELGDWVNYGGDKTWPAPQGWEHAGQWAGPPDPVLDSGPYRAETEQDTDRVAVTLTSGDDPRTGLRLTRHLELRRGECRYRLRLTARNTRDRPVRWSLWNVTQLAADGPGGTYVAGPPAVTPLLAGTAFPEHTAPSDDRVYVPHQDVVGKLGFPRATGWLAHVGEAATLTQSFDVSEGAEYPDAGSRVEIWLECPLPAPLEELGRLDPPARIVECEVLGPLTTLNPGEQTALTLDCGVTAGGTEVRDVTQAGHWSRGPHVRGERVTGEFVAYRGGDLVVGTERVPARCGRVAVLDARAVGAGRTVVEFADPAGGRTPVGVVATRRGES